MSGCFPDDALKAPRRDASLSDFDDIPREGPDATTDAPVAPADARADLDADASLDAKATDDLSTPSDGDDVATRPDAGVCDLVPRTAVPSNNALEGFSSARDFVFDGHGGVVAAVGAAARLYRSGLMLPIATVPSGEVVALRYTRAGHLVLAAVTSNDAGMSSGAIYVVPRETTTVTPRRTGLVRPGGLAVDADDNVWFSDTAGGGVWRMSAMGADDPVRVVADVPSPGLLAFNADATALFVVNTSTTTVYRVALAPDGDGGLAAAGPAESWFSVATTGVLGLGVDECGAVYVGDEDRNVIWRRGVDRTDLVRVVTDIHGPRSVVFGVGSPFDARTLYALAGDTGQLRGANVVARGVTLAVGP